MILPEKYELCGYLCSGGSAAIVECENVVNCERLVAKLVSFENNSKGKSFYHNEVAILHELRHCPNIITLIDCASTNSTGCLILPKMRGDLLSLIDEEGKFDEERAKAIFYQICLGVKMCHDHDIAHLDIKPDNILQSYTGEFYLADFGGAKRINEENIDCLMITKVYASPELRQIAAGEACIDPLAADIWSLGIVLFTMLTGCWPYSINHDDLTADTPVQLDHPQISSQARRLLEGILRDDPKDRPTIDELLANPWFLPAPQESRKKKFLHSFKLKSPFGT